MASEELKGVQTRQRRVRNLTTERIKWTEEMERSILDYAKDSIASGKGFEKPSAPHYYRKFLEAATGFENVTVDKVVQHVKILKKAYTTALEWRNKTGQGILESDPEAGQATVEAVLLRMCKYFKELDEILGDKPQFKPPFIFQSGCVDIAFGEPDVPITVEDELTTSNASESTHTSKQEDIATEKLQPQRKKVKKSPVKTAAAALESAMKMRTDCEEKRLEWEKDCHQQKRDEELALRQAEADQRESQMNFEKKKWEDELKRKQLADDREFELQKLRIERENELARFKMEKEFELEILKLKK